MATGCPQSVTAYSNAFPFRNWNWVYVTSKMSCIHKWTNTHSNFMQFRNTLHGKCLTFVWPIQRNVHIIASGFLYLWSWNLLEYIIIIHWGKCIYESSIQWLAPFKCRWLKWLALCVCVRVNVRSLHIEIPCIFHAKIIYTWNAQPAMPSTTTTVRRALTQLTL